ncbi:anti-diruetic peptide [Asbolus verrucosus]|nr:anti-diruetic peptide [Asbolus verrucosus]
MNTLCVAVFVAVVACANASVVGWGLGGGLDSAAVVAGPAGTVSRTGLGVISAPAIGAPGLIAANALALGGGALGLGLTVVVLFVAVAAASAGIIAGPLGAPIDSAAVVAGPSGKIVRSGLGVAAPLAIARAAPLAFAPAAPAVIARAAPLAVAHAAPLALAVPAGSGLEGQWIPDINEKFYDDAVAAANAGLLAGHLGVGAPVDSAAVISGPSGTVARSGLAVAHAAPLAVAHAAPYAVAHGAIAAPYALAHGAIAAPLAYAVPAGSGLEGQWIPDINEKLYDDGSYKPHIYGF